MLRLPKLCFSVEVLLGDFLSEQEAMESDDGLGLGAFLSYEPHLGIYMVRFSGRILRMEDYGTYSPKISHHSFNNDRHGVF